MKLTFEKVQELIEEVNAWVNKNPDEGPFKSCILKVAKSAGKEINKAMDPLREGVEDLQNDLAFIIENKAYALTKDGNRKQSPETLRAFNEKKREFTKKFMEEVQAVELEIKPCICTNVPNDLSDTQKELFKGILI